MVFSSILFLIYFLPALLVCYFLIKNKYKNGLLLLASIFFYSWGAPKFIFVIIGTTCLDYMLVKKMSKQENKRKRKRYLILCVFINVGLLFYFKYCNFFLESINELFFSDPDEGLNLLNVVLPIGISFYTFESLTYVIDVYRRKHEPLNHFLNYLLYIILFPKLIAGPIIRYHEIADQLTDRFKNYNIELVLIGFRRFVFGLAKKIIIANAVAEVASEIFASDVSQLNAYYAWIGMLAFSVQIYFDFSGYCDMAIGIGQMLGFKFPENFDNPYSSMSISEFWRRWHMTLGTWMKNYLYIPLGGNQVDSKVRLFFNLWVVFLISGFWHGASWTFIVWGAYHGLWLILDRLGFEKLLRKTGKYVASLITFLIVSLGWVYFNADDLNHGNQFVSALFRFTESDLNISIYLMFWVSLVSGLIFSFWRLIPSVESIQNKICFEIVGLRSTISLSVASFLLLLVCLSYITTSQFNPFIYFRF